MLDDVEAQLARFRLRLVLIHSFFSMRNSLCQFQGVLKEIKPADLPAPDVIEGMREEASAMLAALADLTKAHDLMQPLPTLEQPVLALVPEPETV